MRLFLGDLTDKVLLKIFIKIKKYHLDILICNLGNATLKKS